MRVWIDIDNPPQVQYLLPFRAAFAEMGVDTVLTARDYGATLSLLEQAGVEARVSGTRVGRSKLRKVAALAARARDLRRIVGRGERPLALLAASRPSAAAARALGIPSYIIGDYEYANLSAYWLTGSYIMHPDVIDPATFRRRGIPRSRLIAFRGLKEDLSFAGLEIAGVAPHDLGPRDDDGVVRVLFRPPSETSHYYDEASSAMARAALRRLAETGAQVVLSPREAGQVRFLDGLEWRHAPIVLERPVPFVALLKAVDAVVCSGGTMLREAAYLGIPAYSIFQSRIGGVDRWLARIGRVSIIAGEADLARLAPVRRPELEPLRGNATLLRDLAGLIVGGRTRPAPVTPG